MSQVFLMHTIVSRGMLPKILSFYQEMKIAANLVTLGRGTAASEVLDYFGLEASEKAVLFSVVTDSAWQEVKKGLTRRFRIDVPGTGIAFCVPMASVGGRRELEFLTQNQDYRKGEESGLKNTAHEMLVVISNQGYTELVMDAAKKAGAGGGTVIHARGTGMEKAEAFFGISLASEKEMTFIVAKSSQKKAIMESVMREAGMESKAKAIVFSLPVTDTAGLRLVEAEEE